MLLVEGITLFSRSQTLSRLELRYFLTLSRASCKSRREARTDYDPPDVEGYFDRVVWPAYETHAEEAGRVDGVIRLSGEEPLLANAKRIVIDVLDKE